MKEILARDDASESGEESSGSPSGSATPPQGNPPPGSPALVSIADIAGVTPPAMGEPPVTEITVNDEYSGSVEWNPVISGTFAAETVYTATITLEPKAGYTFEGVATNFFTVAGSVATNAAGSGVVRAVFPETALVNAPGLYTTSGYTIVSGPDPASASFPKEVFDYVNANPGDYYMAIDRDYEVNGGSLVLDGDTNGVYSLTIEGMEKERTISLKAGTTGSLVWLYYFDAGSVTFTLENNLTLKGHANNTAALVRIEGSRVNRYTATFSMKTGSKVTGNTLNILSAINIFGDRNGYGGGVYVDGGMFSMTGGTISGNKILPVFMDSTSNGFGGGVYLGIGGMFSMTGGSISGNEVRARAGSNNYALAYGGGVYVDLSAEFAMSGGTISGNTVHGDQDEGNSVMVHGGGVYVSESHFSMTGGIIEGNGVSATGTNLTAYGGGVYAYRYFSKTRGTITGKGDASANTVSPESGNAGYAVSAYGKFRNSTADDNTTLNADTADNWGE